MMRGFGFFSQREGCLSFRDGEEIFEEGQAGNLMYVIIHGDVVIMKQGAVIDRLAEGDIFGEMSLVDTQPRSAAAIAKGDTLLLPVDRDRFAQLVQEEPDFALSVMAIISTRLRRLMKEEARRQRLEKELAIGRQIQLGLLPNSVPTLPGWDVAASYRAAREVGGDLYDFILTPEQLHLIVADVTGKGVPAALMMATNRAFIHAQAMHGHSPATALGNTNQFIMQDGPARLFLSAFYATIDLANGRLTYANGGLDWPLWWRAATGKITLLDAPGMVLGAFANVPLQDRHVQIDEGDALIFFTDGITEARNADCQFFGDERLAGVIAEHAAGSAQQLVTAIETAVADFVADMPQSDDLTLVVIKRTSS